MDHARIRWRNVARIAGGLGAAGLLVAVAPGLLEPPEPPPLPDDVGLATGATGQYAYAPVEEPGSGDGSTEPRKRDGRPDRTRSPGHPAKPDHPKPDRRRPPASDERQVEPPASPPAAPAPAIAPPPPAAPPASAPPTAAPPSPAPPPAEPGEPAELEASQASPSRGPSQFGFEH